MMEISCYMGIVLMIATIYCSSSFGEPLVDTTADENATAVPFVSAVTNDGNAIPASPVQILGRLPLRMIQGTTRPVVFGFANFLGEFYSLDITSSDSSVVRVVETNGIQLLSPPTEDAIVLPNNTTNANNDSLEFAMSIANFTLKGVRFGKANLFLRLKRTDTGEIDEELSDLLPSPPVAVIRMPT